MCACVRARVCVEQLFEWIHRIQSAAEVRTRKSNATVKYSTKVPGGSAREREREKERERENTSCGTVSESMENGRVVNLDQRRIISEGRFENIRESSSPVVV